MIRMKRLGEITVIRGTVMCACLSMILFSSDVTVSAKLMATTKVTTEATTEAKTETEILGYVGNVISRVNIRVAAGEKNDKLLQDGEGVYLEEGDEVLIISETKVGKKTWYQVRFTKNREELIGFGTSTYIKKTSTAITPSPTITPEPTATPTPTNPPNVTLVPTEAPVAPTDVDDVGSGSSSKLLYIGIAVLSLLGVFAVGTVFYRKRKQEKEDTTGELTQKVAQLKNIKIEKNTPQDKPIAAMKRRPEVKVSQIKEEPYKETLSPNVYVKKGMEERVSEEFAASAESIDSAANVMIREDNLNAATARENVRKDNEEKKALRVAIEQLREHDVVIHKYFGRGEVFDNADVRLIEVRFGGDVRFLNKETLTTKKLITITNERKR